jgi:hypothetical protein
MKETYEELLARAPKDHFSEEFIAFLANNNKVRYNNSDWLVIENCKYHNEENDWLTAFYVGDMLYDDCIVEKMSSVMYKFPDREVLIKAPSERSVKLFHVHLYKK